MSTHNQQAGSDLSSPAMSAVGVVTTPTQKGPRALTLVRYLAVGACNTIFGYGCYALFTLLLSPIFSYGYVLASLLANLFSITFAFFGYKWFVFKTHGNYLKEWVRCLGVYAGSMILSRRASLCRRHHPPPTRPRPQRPVYSRCHRSRIFSRVQLLRPSPHFLRRRQSVPAKRTLTS